MTIRTITPYLSFDGDAAEAIEHYVTHLGAEVDRHRRLEAAFRG